MDFNERLEGNSFTDTKDWKPMLTQWNAYAGEEFGKLVSCSCNRLDTHHTLPVVLGVDHNDDDEEDDDEEDGDGKGTGSRRKSRRKDEYPLESDAYGLPVIPDFDDLGLESKKSLIRTFVTKHYSKFHNDPSCKLRN